jgi:hypothetical protein
MTFFYILLIGLMGMPFLVIPPGSHAGPLETLARALPKKIHGWVAEGDDRYYDRETIFGYINGGAEVYRAYNMKLCFSRQYTKPDAPVITLDVFEMATAADAFGVFTHDRDGQVLELGQGALYRPGWLSFWKGPLFVSIYADEETGEGTKAVNKIGELVDTIIPTRGSKPPILEKLPREGLHQRSIRYLHHFVILNYHYFLANENILNLGPGAHAVLADYAIGAQKARLLVIAYPDPVAAETAYVRFTRYYIPESKTGTPVQLENGKWAAAIRDGCHLNIVLEADGREMAEKFLDNKTE